MSAPLNLDQFEGFTPGPWATVALIHGYAVTDRAGDTVCMDFMNGEDDARLIAAAPALLAECRSQREQIARLRGALMSADPVAARRVALAGTEGHDVDGHPIPTVDPLTACVEWIKQRRANGLDFRSARADYYAAAEAARAALAGEGQG